MAQAWHPTQAQTWLQQQGARYVTTKDGINWYRLPDTNWVAWTQLPNGYVELKKLPAASCGC